MTDEENESKSKSDRIVFCSVNRIDGADACHIIIGSFCFPQCICGYTRSIIIVIF